MTPVDSFEIQIGNIGLGAWDLIGIFGLDFCMDCGFVTLIHDVLATSNEANSREELEQVALRWEYSLMLLPSSRTPTLMTFENALEDEPIVLKQTQGSQK